MTTGSPRITFTSFTIAGNTFYPRTAPRTSGASATTSRFSYDARGRHDLQGRRRLPALPSTTATTARRAWAWSTPGTARRPPTSRRCFPMRSTPTPGTWRRSPRSSGPTTSASATSSPTTSGRSSARGCRTTGRLSSSLTLNLGLRYDLSVNANGNDYAVPPFVEAGRPDDTNNLQPRVGFAYQLTDRTVVRGGTGLYFAVPLSVETFWMAQIVQTAVIQFTNDGRAELRRGSAQRAAAADARAGATSASATSGTCPDACALTIRGIDRVAGSSHGGSRAHVAVLDRRRSGRWAATMAFEADYVYSQGVTRRTSSTTST